VTVPWHVGYMRGRQWREILSRLECYCLGCYEA